MKNRALDKLLARILEHVMDDLDWLADEPEVGDSPIERLFFTAMLARTKYIASEYNGLRFTRDPAKLVGLLDDEQSRNSIVMGLQQKLGEWWVDYLVHAFDWRTRSWRQLIVECDGHDFHERTKEQARKDRSRDRGGQLAGIPVFRFTGSELWRDALACAEQVHDWATQGI
jgi:very-short-patch-repair endonuclease